MKTVYLIGFFALGCAASVDDGSNAPESPFHFNHNLTGYEGCLDARSTDPSKVQLRGPTCTDDGAECFDFPEHDPVVEVWATDQAEVGTPFGADSFVEVKSCGS